MSALIASFPIRRKPCDPNSMGFSVNFACSMSSDSMYSNALASNLHSARSMSLDSLYLPAFASNSFSACTASLDAHSSIASELVTPLLQIILSLTLHRFIRSSIYQGIQASVHLDSAFQRIRHCQYKNLLVTMILMMMVS